MAMMQQAYKVELFKKTRSRADSLHAKYSISECPLPPSPLPPSPPLSSPPLPIPLLLWTTTTVCVCCRYLLHSGRRLWMGPPPN